MFLVKKFGYLLLLLFFVMAGCRVHSKFALPEKQFIYIVKQTQVLACHKETEICLTAKNGKGFASGFLINHRNNKSYYLTAGHVCFEEIESQNLDFEAKVSSEINIFAFDNSKNKASVVAIDKQHDICLLEAEKVNHIPAVMSKKAPKQHTPIINVAAPAGIWSQKTMLHFEGEFQGNKESKRVDDLYAVYVITAQPGSSGSPIYDPMTGKVIGMITHVLSGSYGVAFGPTTEQINNFLNENLPE